MSTEEERLTVAEFKELTNSSQRRLLIERPGMSVRVDMNLAGVLAIVRAGLEAIIEQASAEDKCPFCEQEGTCARDCEIDELLASSLRELREIRKGRDGG